MHLKVHRTRYAGHSGNVQNDPTALRNVHSPSAALLHHRNVWQVRRAVGGQSWWRQEHWPWRPGPPWWLCPSDCLCCEPAAGEGQEKTASPAHAHSLGWPLSRFSWSGPGQKLGWLCQSQTRMMRPRRSSRRPSICCSLGSHDTHTSLPHSATAKCGHNDKMHGLRKIWSSCFSLITRFAAMRSKITTTHPSPGFVTVSIVVLRLVFRSSTSTHPVRFQRDQPWPWTQQSNFYTTHGSISNQGWLQKDQHFRR